MAKAKKEPARAPSAVLCDELRRCRLRKEWTQDDMAKRVTELGIAVDRATIAKIETGKRNVSVDDVFVLAMALDVSPIQLLLPHEVAAPVAVTPTTTEIAGRVRAWMRGYVPLNWRDVKAQRFYFEQIGDDEWQMDQLGIAELVAQLGTLIDYANSGDDSREMQDRMIETCRVIKMDADRAMQTLARS